MSRHLARSVFVAALVLSTVVLLAPAAVVAGASSQDKAQHLATFAVLAILGRAARIAPVPLGLGLVGYGAVTEVLQAVLPIGRYGDVRDLAADAVGVLLGLLAAALVARWRAKVGTRV